MSSSSSRADPQSSTTYKRWAPDKIRRIVKDIQDSPKISLLALLTALLARLLLDDKDIDASKPLHSGKVKQSKTLIDLMLHDAHTFCNDNSNAKAIDLKRHLRNYCTRKIENFRHASLCHALNTILSEYRDKQFGDLPAPNQRDDKEELIFIPNALVALESDHIAQHMPRSKRRPDVLATYTSTLRENFENHKGAGFEDWVEIYSDDRCAGPSRSTERLRWTDVHQPWEVASTAIVDVLTSERGKQEVEKAILASHTQDRSTSAQQRNSRKRRSEEELFGRSKKARVDSEPEPKPFRLQVADEQSNLLPHLRCAYYATERLASAWYLTHGTAVELEDTRLSLRWYDAQGCFESEPIDIVEQMPQLVVMLTLLQRFNKRMWGLNTENVESEKGTFLPDRETQCRFELVGRRTFGSPAMRVPVAELSASNAKDEIPLFYKSSWVKRTDLKEPDTINVANERANTLLPEKFRKMVTDHIPTVIASRVCSEQSTSTIRLLIGEVEESMQFKKEDIRKHARVRVWLVTRKLEPIEGLDPPDFWQTFLELLRCHYLLWKIGIANRDISITNLMCTKHNGALTGVLDDYDCAAVMDPGCRHPASDGYDRVGTTPFMSVDLPVYRDSALTRWYRHDMESFAWCLIWEMLRSPPRSWAEGRLDETCISKKSFMCSVSDHLSEIREDWLPFFLFAVKWFNSLRDRVQKFDLEITLAFLSSGERRTDREKIALRDAEDKEKDDTEYVQYIVDIAREKKHTQGVDVVQDDSWVSVVLL